MRNHVKITGKVKRLTAAVLAGSMICMAAACGSGTSNQNLVTQEENSERNVNLFSPMEKTAPDAENMARSAADTTILGKPSG